METTMRTYFVILTLIFGVLTMPASYAQQRPKVIFFDVNETLLDLEAMRTSVAGALDANNNCYRCGFQPCYTIHW